MPAAPFLTPPLRRAIIVLTSVRLIVNTMERFVYPFLPAIARGLGVPLDQAALLLSVRSGTSLAMPAVVATVGRGGRRRRLMTVAMVLTALGALIVAGPWGFAGAMVGFVLIGLGKPTYDVGALSYVADRTPYERRARVLGFMEVTFAGGLLIGTPLMGLLIDGFDWRGPFVAIAVLLAVAIPVLRRNVERGHPEGGDEPVKLRVTPRMVAFLVVVSMFMAGTETTFIVMGAWLEDDFGLSILALGGIALFLGFAELLGEGLVVGLADRLGKRGMAVGGLVVGATGFALIPLAGTSSIVGLSALALALFGFEIGIVSAIPLASEMAPGARASFIALFGTSMLVGRLLGSLVGPRLYLEAGISGNALATSATYLLAAFLLTRVVHSDRPAQA
ncbi:MAG: putative MFS family arabinose efflux permease [Glaciecola sp.]|jgi:predicted MFS family arabinose efflux permease